MITLKQGGEKAWIVLKNGPELLAYTAPKFWSEPEKLLFLLHEDILTPAWPIAQVPCYLVEV